MPTLEKKYDNLVKHIRTEKELEKSESSSKAQKSHNISHQKNSGAKKQLHDDSGALLNVYKQNANFADMIKTQLAIYENAKTSGNQKEQVYTALVIGTAIQDAFNNDPKKRKKYTKDEHLSSAIGKVNNENYGLIQQEILQSRRNLAHNIGTRGVNKNSDSIVVTAEDIQDAENIVGISAGDSKDGKAKGLYRLAEILDTQQQRDTFRNARHTDFTIYQNHQAALAAAASAPPAPTPVASTPAPAPVKATAQENSFSALSRGQSSGSSSSESSKEEPNKAAKQKTETQNKEKDLTSKQKRNQRRRQNRKRNKESATNQESGQQTRTGSALLIAAGGAIGAVAGFILNRFSNKSAELNGAEEREQTDASSMAVGSAVGALGAAALQAGMNHTEKYQNSGKKQR